MIKYQSDSPLSLENEKPKRILIVQTAFIGDVVLITALIRESALLFPEAQIDVLLIPSTAALLKNNPHINQLIVYDKKKKNLFFSIVGLLKSRHYDLALIPHSSARTAIILWLAGIKVRIGYNRWFARHLLTHRLNHRVDPTRKAHKIEKLLNLLSLFTKEKLNMDTELYPDVKDYQFSDSILSQNTDNRKVVLIAPGSVWATKRWNKNYYTEVCKTFQDNGLFVILSGSKSEETLCQEIMEKCSNKESASIINICGKSTLLQTAAIIKKCDLVLCNDSGTLHIANAMKTTVFAIFGPTVRGFGYYPFREGDHVFEVNLPCRPCGGHGHHACPLKHHRCMNDIKPEMICDKILSFIAEEK